MSMILFRIVALAVLITLGVDALHRHHYRYFGPEYVWDGTRYRKCHTSLCKQRALWRLQASSGHKVSAMGGYVDNSMVDPSTYASIVAANPGLFMSGVGGQYPRTSYNNYAAGYYGNYPFNNNSTYQWPIFPFNNSSAAYPGQQPIYSTSPQPPCLTSSPYIVWDGAIDDGLLVRKTRRRRRRRRHTSISSSDDEKRHHHKHRHHKRRLSSDAYSTKHPHSKNVH